MQLATVIISALGLLFAAVAAWGAAATVHLTRELHLEESVRRLREALIGLEHAADAARGVIGGGMFPDAQLELKRAREQIVLPNDVEQIINRLIESEAATKDRLVETSDECHRAWLLVSTQPPPRKLPAWWIRLAVWGLKRRHKT